MIQYCIKKTELVGNDAHDWDYFCNAAQQSGCCPTNVTFVEKLPPDKLSHFAEAST